MTSEAPAPRRRLAGDDWVTRFAEGSRFGLRIDCPHAKERWQPRAEARLGGEEHPGTAIHFEGDLWEIVRYGTTERPPLRHVYYLNRWSDGHTPRLVLPYSQETVAEEERRRLERGRRERASWAARLTLPFLGLLPADDQRRVAREYGVSPRAMTAGSAGLLLTLSTVVGLWTFWAALNPGASRALGAWLLPLRFVASCIWIESLARFAYGFLTDEPLGSAMVAVPIGLARASAAALEPGARERATRQARLGKALRDQVLETLDEVRPLPGDPPRLEVRSALGKPHWVIGRTGIAFSSRWWQLVEREELGGDGGERPFRFVLEQIEEGSTLPSYCEYHPEEVQRLWARQLRDARSTWVDTLAPAWGLLDPIDKARLGEVYDYDVERWTRVSIPLFGLLAVPAVFTALDAAFEGSFSVLDLLVLVLCAGLIAEAVWRWRHRDQLPGSLLAGLLRPLARPLLETPSDAEASRHLAVETQERPSPPLPDA